MTQALSVRCQNCGSSLQVSESIRFITCGYCHSELQVVRDASTVHTEVLGRIEQNTQATVNQLKVIEIQNDIEQLDREWQMWREKNLTRDKSGALVDPPPPTFDKNPGTALAFSILIGLLLAGLLWVVGAPGMATMLALVVPAVIVIAMQVQNETSVWFAREFAKYEKTRKELLQKLALARKGPSSDPAHSPAVSAVPISS